MEKMIIDIVWVLIFLLWYFTFLIMAYYRDYDCDKMTGMDIELLIMFAFLVLNLAVAMLLLEAISKLSNLYDYLRVR